MATLQAAPRRAKKKPRIYKEYAFSTTDRAEMEFAEACNALKSLTRIPPESIIEKVGNVVRIPAWFPYVPSN